MKFFTLSIITASCLFSATRAALKDSKTAGFRDDLEKFCASNPKTVEGAKVTCGKLKGEFALAIKAANGSGGNECKRTLVANQFVENFPEFDAQLGANMCIAPVNQIIKGGKVANPEVPCTDEKFIGKATPTIGEFGKLVANDAKGEGTSGNRPDATANSDTGANKNASDKKKTESAESSKKTPSRAENKAAKKAANKKSKKSKN
ncbi:hypothetical protein HK099_007783 [Clydaea vesicula]|uniref:Uncharacterized protein n=1 Tax=Clydaea vesicula TaxID=447962 RepID=A0AAD5U6K5_9FUNG|nr:hypothetical protein HK099_007783 [Clydaea vesicula]KAJ3395921.1 hypothetical protein HDU92_004596 [Lobulomyces angularis]